MTRNRKTVCKRLLSLCTVVGLVASAGACGAADVSADVPDGPTISIGIPTDEPALGWVHDGQYSGLDVSVATHVAHALGYARKQVDFKRITPSTGQQMLENSDVVMLVSSLPLNADDYEDLLYAGPYLNTQQDLLVRAEDKSRFTDLASLKGASICTAKGSGAAQNLRQSIDGVALQERNTYPQCITALMIGEVDAVSADQAVLSGLISLNDRSDYSLLNIALAQTSHAIQLKTGETELAKKINDALAAMQHSGVLSKIITTMSEETGYTPTSLLR